MMPPALLCLTAVYTILPSISDAALLGANGARALQADSTTPGYTIEVKPDGAAATDKYRMTVEPKYSNNNRDVLFNVHATFDSKRGADISKSITSYDLTDGLATATSTRESGKSQCLSSESGNYKIPAINAIFGGIMGLGNFAPLGSDQCPEQYDFTVGGIGYSACNKKSGSSLTITGNGLTMDVTYSTSGPVGDGEGSRIGCSQVAKPMTVKEGAGRSLLNLWP